MILLKSLICLLSIVILLHFIKFFKDRNSEKEGFSKFNYDTIEEMENKSSSPSLHSPDEHNKILQKMKQNNTNTNKNAIINDTKSEEEIKIEIKSTYCFRIKGQY